MKEAFIKNYWDKQIAFERVGEKLINVEKSNSSIANKCEIGDKVNGEIVELVMLGMCYCYCVFTKNGHCYYSWNIKTIETKEKKYKIIEKDNKILVEEDL